MRNTLSDKSNSDGRKILGLAQLVRVSIFSAYFGNLCLSRLVWRSLIQRSLLQNMTLNRSDQSLTNQYLLRMELIWLFEDPSSCMTEAHGTPSNATIAEY